MRAQAAVEYLILIGIAMIIAVAVVSVVFDLTPFGDKSGQVDSIANRLETMAVDVQIADAQWDILVKNNDNIPFTINNVTVGGFLLGTRPSLPDALLPGESIV